MMREGGRARGAREGGKELGRKESGREGSEGGISEKKKNGGKESHTGYFLFMGSLNCTHPIGTK